MVYFNQGGSSKKEYTTQMPGTEYTMGKCWLGVGEVSPHSLKVQIPKPDKGINHRVVALLHFDVRVLNNILPSPGIYKRDYTT